jgi:hypothetical protein
MNINIINAPTILIEEGTKAVTLRSIMFLLTVKHIGFLVVRECQHHFKGLNRAVKHYSTVQEMWKYMDLSRYLTKLLPF